jgi:dCMP deaminase
MIESSIPMDLSGKTDRPSWKEYFRQIAKYTASRSPCHRLQVGCLLVKDNRIISQGYNGFLPGAPHESVVVDNHEQATVHAEQNAITDCAKRGVSSNDCDAYITHYPCVNCMKMLCASGVKNIFYIDDYNNDPLVEYFCKISNIRQIVKM